MALIEKNKFSDNISLLRGETKEARPLNIISYLFDKDHIEEFWDESIEDSTRKHTVKAPHGTYVCEELKIISKMEVKK